MGMRTDGKPITPFKGSWAETVNTTPIPVPAHTPTIFENLNKLHELRRQFPLASQLGRDYATVCNRAIFDRA